MYLQVPKRLGGLSATSGGWQQIRTRAAVVRAARRQLVTLLQDTQQATKASKDKQNIGWRLHWDTKVHNTLQHN